MRIQEVQFMGYTADVNVITSDDEDEINNSDDASSGTVTPIGAITPL